MNVALYGPGGRWTMTDRGEAALRQSAESLRIGPSEMRWQDGVLVISIDEIATPHATRIQGEVRITPSAVTDVELVLDPSEAHIWRPLAPKARIEVRLDRSGWSWAGEGYLDANFGTRALEVDFSSWTWARLGRGGGTTCFYDALRRDGSELEVALHFGPGGQVTAMPAPPKTRLRRSLWALPRETRADQGSAAHQVKPMLDAPFYCRSMISSRIGGETCFGVHEALDLNRFASPLLKPMLAMRVPRRRRWRQGVG